MGFTLEHYSHPRELLAASEGMLAASEDEHTVILGSSYELLESESSSPYYAAVVFEGKRAVAVSMRNRATKITVTDCTPEQADLLARDAAESDTFAPDAG